MKKFNLRISSLCMGRLEVARRSSSTFMLYITSRHLCVGSIRVDKSKKLRRENMNMRRGKREERRRE